jgi:hypothetical protein
MSDRRKIGARACARRNVPLSTEDLRTLRTLIAMHGKMRTVSLLKTSLQRVLELESGGFTTPECLAEFSAKLAAFRAADPLPATG